MKKDWFLTLNLALIIAVGITTLYSTVIGKETVLQAGGVINRQLIFIMVGVTVYFLASIFNYSYLGHPQIIIPIYVTILIALGGLLLFGVEINYSKRWILIGNFQLQISEFAKLAVILSTAWIITLKRKHNIWTLAGIAIGFVLPVTALIFIEPDASTALIVILISFIMILTVLPNQTRNIFLILLVILFSILINYILSSSISVVVLLTAGGAILLCLLGLIIFLKKPQILTFICLTIISGLAVGLVARYSWNYVLGDYQKSRISCFIEPEEDPTGACFQVNQAKIAIGSGMLLGKGFGHGTQSKLNFLPEHQTDFIFAAFAEEFGLIGSSFLLLLYISAVYRIFRISASTQDLFGSLICVGVGVKFLLEIVINIGMNLGVVPATGIPLPLMSAGGSMFLATMIALGMVQSVISHRNIVDSE